MMHVCNSSRHSCRCVKLEQFSEMDMQTIAAHLQKEQQQQHSGTSSGTSPASWHSQQTGKSETSNTQSPQSGDQSPGYSEMSPINHQGLPTSPNQSLAPAWYVSTSQAQQATAAPNTSVLDVKTGDDPNKQVVCSICQRRFKNVPALNGHMRLHGGYFKKDSALKEEKKKKEMAPPSNVPSRPNTSLGPVLQSLPLKKAKDTPPLHSPPSEELHALHWQQKQEQQFQQQLQHDLQQHQKQQQKSKLDLHLQSSSLQIVQENLNQIRQKILLQQQEQQFKQQQIQLLQQQQQAQLEQRQQEQQQAVLNSLDILQLANLQQSELDQQEMEEIKVHIHQLQIQQQLQQQQNHQEEQQHFLFDNPHTHIGTQQPSNMYSTNHIPQSPHLPNSPTYSHTGSVPQSPHMPQSNLVQCQGSLEPVHTPATAEYGNPSVLIPTMEDIQSYGDSNLAQDISDYGVLHASDEVILQNFHQQLQSQGLCVDSVQDFHDSLQNVNIGNELSNHSLTACDSDNINSQLHQLTFSTAADVHNDQSAFDSQLSGHFGPLDHSDGSTADSSHTASEIVSQIITSLENLGEVPRGSMQQIHEHKGDQDLHIPKLYPDNSQKYYQHSPMDNETDIFEKNSFRDIAHDNVVHNPNSVSNYNMPVVSLHVTPLTDSRISVKQELLKHLTSKPSSPRASHNTQMSFQNIPNSFSFTKNTVAQRQRHHSAKADIPSSLVVIPKPQLNSELKRRLSAGPDDIRAHIYSFSNGSDQNRDKLPGTYVKPALFRSDDMLRPRMRSKSGDDFRMIRFENDDTFMKPKEMSDDFIHRPRSKTDEHLPKWKNNDGEGIFRNPSSFAPGSFKMRRKNRPAPLFIPSHASMCGFQSRLRSPRISLEGVDGAKANTAPVPYTPPPMLSPLRRGSGLFCALQSSFTPQSTHSSGHPLSTPRPSLLRSASVSKSEDDTCPFAQEEQPPPESDTQPHVNIGPQYQAVLPDFHPNIHLALSDVSKEDLVFDPACLRDNTEEDVQFYQELACSAVVVGNGINVEHALHLLYINNGDIQKALLMLMKGSCKLPQSHTLTSYKYQESDVWSFDEIENYTKAVLKFDKDFFKIAMEVKTKNVRQSIQFYYLWKKVLVDDHKRLRAIRRRREQDYNLRSTRQQALVSEETVCDEGGKVVESAPMEDNELDVRELTGDEDDSLSEASMSVGTVEDHAEKDVDGEEKVGVPVEEMNVKTTCAPSVFACTYHECSSKFSSKAAVNTHHKIHARVTRPPPSLSSVFETTTSPSRSPVRNTETSNEEVFPCKLCGRIFGKVKSRSAHMKIHRPDQDKEREKKAKLAKQAAAVAAASMEQSFMNPFRYTSLANGSSQI